MLPFRRFAIDPATNYVGWAYINENDEADAGYWDYHKLDYHSTLVALSQDIARAIYLYEPDMVAIENQIAIRNGRTVRLMSEVVGVCKVSVLREDVPIVEVPAVTVRRLIIPQGQPMDKEHLSHELHRRYRGLTWPDTKTFDASDALGLAVALPLYLAEKEMGKGGSRRRAPRGRKHGH